jgi:hypothetical protein
MSAIHSGGNKRSRYKKTDDRTEKTHVRKRLQNQIELYGDIEKGSADVKRTF